MKRWSTPLDALLTLTIIYGQSAAHCPTDSTNYMTMPQQVTSLRKPSSLNAAQVIAKMDQHILLQLAKQSLLLESHYETLRISSRALLPMPTSVVMTSTTFLMHTQK
jgi:hypothetical protein